MSRPTLEQIDYLRWYNGDNSEYTYFDTDGNGRVKHPGYALETSWSWDAYLTNQGDDDADDPIEMRFEAVKAGDVPSPDRALTEYRNFDGIDVLSEREKDVFLLTHVCLMEPRRIAEYLGIRAQTVKNLLQRAKLKLHR